MADVNEMSMDDLVKFAEEGVLPDNLNFEAAAESAPQGEEGDAEALSPEDLLALAQGKTLEVEEDGLVEGAEVEDGSEASADELLAMLGDTLTEDELAGTHDQANTEMAKEIDKIKLRELANKIMALAPGNLFPPKKDEVYYFLTSMCGQSAEQEIEDAEKKCIFIGKAIQKLHTIMLSEIGLSLDEVETLDKLFSKFSEKTIHASEARDRVADQLGMGWRNTYRLVMRDVEILKRYTERPSKPLWVVVKFYETLSRVYGLCRAQDDLAKVNNDSVNMTAEDKRSIIDGFEEILHISPAFGLKKLEFINREEAYAEVAKLQLDVILSALKKKK